MSFLGFALFAEVKVWADTALVSDTLDWVSLASITSYALVNLCQLVSSLFTKVIHHQSLEGLGGVGFDFLSKDLDQVIEEFAVKGA